MDEAVATSPTLLPDSLNSSSSLRFPSLHFECYLTPPSSLPGTRQEVAGVGPPCVRCRSTGLFAYAGVQETRLCIPDVRLHHQDLPSASRP
jgi:hypothetical protein